MNKSLLSYAKVNRDLFLGILIGGSLVRIINIISGGDGVIIYTRYHLLGATIGIFILYPILVYSFDYFFPEE